MCGAPLARHLMNACFRSIDATSFMNTRNGLQRFAAGLMHAEGGAVDERTPMARTVHVVLPDSGRSLCGYEEERPGSEGATAVPCPECTALLRSGLVARRSRTRAQR